MAKFYYGTKKNLARQAVTHDLVRCGFNSWSARKCEKLINYVYAKYSEERIRELLSLALNIEIIAQQKGKKAEIITGLIPEERLCLPDEYFDPQGYDKYDCLEDVRKEA